MLDSWQARRLSSEPLEATRGRFLPVPSCHHRLTYTKSVIHELDGLGVYLVDLGHLHIFLFVAWVSFFFRNGKANICEGLIIELESCTKRTRGVRITWKKNIEKHCRENGSRWVCKRRQSHFGVWQWIFGTFWDRAVEGRFIRQRGLGIALLRFYRSTVCHFCDSCSPELRAIHSANDHTRCRWPSTCLLLSKLFCF